jgi:hypothetical protein
MLKPVFVIGKNRSGTKWLSNILANHPNVACVQGEEFGGIIETNLFHTFPEAFGNLKKVENYCAMASCFSKTSFFLRTGLSEDILFRTQTCDYLDFFRNIMEAYCAKEGKTCWLQKANPLVLSKLYSSFPDARFILTSRDMVDNIRSTIGLAHLANDNRPSALARECALYYLSLKMSRLYQGKPNVMSVTYEDLRRDKRHTTEVVCAFLELPFEEAMLEDRYEKNTSFQRGINRDEILRPKDIRRLYMLSILFRFMPIRLLRLSRDRFGSHRNPDESRFIPASFSILRKQYNLGDEDQI